MAYLYKLFCGNFAEEEKKGFWVFANHPTVHSGGVSMGRSMEVAIDFGDRLQVTCDT